MEPCVVWKFPSPPIADPAPWGHHWKTVRYRGAQPTGNYANQIGHDRHGIPRFDCRISLYRLKRHTSDNFFDIHKNGINPFPLWNLRKMCSFERFSSRGCLTWSCSVYTRLPLRRHRACLATYSPSRGWAPPRTRGVAWISAARGTTGDPTRVWWRVQPRLLTQKWSIPTMYHEELKFIYWLGITWLYWPPPTNCSPIGRRLFADSSENKKRITNVCGGSDRTVVALVAADFGHWPVWSRLQWMCDWDLILVRVCGCIEYGRLRHVYQYMQ